MFPNMQLIDLSFCHYIFQHGIAVLLKRCPKITHFKFVGFPHAKLRSINSEASILEVLNLAHSRIDDEGLYQISKTCPQLLQLDLEHCHNVTEKGVQLAVENCTRLREINLQHCHKVSTDIVSQMIFTRPSLRKIIAPPHFHPRDCDRKLLFERCLVF
ncbi:putative F-box/LRR protein [Trifolium pratense]|uniref:Putative F-box/LRR protein n=3 Tax=Trifolium pratense TaxID=57577 RepID=A0A2K3LWS8_TRIPR|nr:putative F-box/LRR protein [Trifolium pratense]